MIKLNKRASQEIKPEHVYTRKYKDKVKRDNAKEDNRDLPTIYETNVLPYASDIPIWIEEGLTIKEICVKLSISHSMWYKMIKEHEGLENLVSLGERLLCNRAEKSLVNLCTGFEYIEYKTTVEEDAQGKKHVKTEEMKRYQPPSQPAISFLLRNRMPDRWSDKKELMLDTKDNELKRKELFKQMLDNPPIQADCKEITNNDKSE